jgi:signal transduction histidine kinase
MNLVVSGTVLLLAVLAFFAYDLISFRQNLIRNLESSAQMVGASSVSAVVFDDPQTATMNLNALGSSPDVDAAILATSDGKVFAKYQRQAQTQLPHQLALSPDTVNDYQVSGESVLLAHRITFQGKSVATIYIAARLRETAARALQYLMIALAILALGLIAALVISSRAGKTVAQPMIALAQMARLVSRERNYSVRATPVAGQAEVEILIEAFNEMLREIENQNTTISRARDQLEMRVQERTVQLQAANRELEAFSYTVAHDLRGPVDAILGTVYLLETEGDRGSASDRMLYLDQIRKSTSNMSALIDDLLKLSQASTAALQKETVDPTEVVSQIAGDLKRSEPNREVDIVVGQVPPLLADPGLLRVVLDNLIRNAWKYTSKHERARIEFGAERKEGSIHYFVRDDGAGFDPKMRDQLFQPFHRLHSSQDFTGNGIGLATVQRIITRHRGRIWAEGELERGATFWFTWGA